VNLAPPDSFMFETRILLEETVYRNFKNMWSQSNHYSQLFAPASLAVTMQSKNALATFAGYVYVPSEEKASLREPS
jgi:hypothetical protein